MVGKNILYHKLDEKSICPRQRHPIGSISGKSKTELKKFSAKNAPKTGFFPRFLEDVLANTQSILYNKTDHQVNDTNRVGMRLPGERMEEKRI